MATWQRGRVHRRVAFLQCSCLNPAMARSTHQRCDLASKPTMEAASSSGNTLQRCYLRRAQEPEHRQVRTPPQTTALGSARRRRILRGQSSPCCTRQPLQAELVPLHRADIAHGRGLATDRGCTLLGSSPKKPDQDAYNPQTFLGGLAEALRETSSMLRLPDPNFQKKKKGKQVQRPPGNRPPKTGPTSST